MADAAARNGSISPLESGRTQKVTFRNILRGTFLVPSSNNKRSRGVLSQSYITWYRAIWARGRVGKRPRWVDFSHRDFNKSKVFKMITELILICCRLLCVSWRKIRCVARLLRRYVRPSVFMVPSWIETWSWLCTTLHYRSPWTCLHYPLLFLLW